MKVAASLIVLIAAGFFPQQPTFRSTASLVRIEVAVTDERGPVQGLRADDFVVTDRGALQRPTLDELTDTPLDVIAVVQPLESMRRTSEQQAPRAAAGFMAFLANVDERDRLGLVLARTPPVRLRSLSFGRPDLDTRAIEDGPYAATFDAITAGLGEFLPSDRRRVLVAFTNAADFRSTVGLEALARRARHLGPAFVLVGSPTMIQQSISVGAETTAGVHIGEYATAVVSGFVFPITLTDLARRTGGITIDLGQGNPKDLMDKAFAWMRTRYVLSYSSPPGKGWHPLTVKANRRGVTVTVRDGYFVE